MWIRTAVAAAVIGAVWAANVGYNDAVLAPAAEAAAVHQVDGGDGTNVLGEVHARRRWADGAAAAVTAVVALAWVATLDVRPRSVFIDRRGTR